MSRVKRGAPYVVVLAILGLLVAHVPFFASSEAQAPPPAYRALYDTYISPSIDKVYQTGQASLSGWSASAPSREAAWAATCDRCLVNSTICNKFGSHNVDLSRSFDGTGGRVQRVLKRAMAGEPIEIGAMGGSISLGHGCNCHPWHAQVGEWWNATFPNEGNSFRVGAVGGRGSNYFQYCHNQHVDEDVDLILVEMSVNDIYLNLEAQHTFETLLRALLSYPKHPAVIYLRTFQTQQELGTGGELHVSTLQYYDVPVIGVRDWMLPKIMADWSASEQWFVWSEGKDKLHPLGQAHTAMAEMIQLYLEQQLCYINNDRPYIPPSNHPLVPQENQFASLDALPRVRLNQRLTENNTTPDIISTCASVDSKEHPLTPVAAATHGWEFWLQPPQMEKRYWRSTEVGSVITFDMELTVGNINLYYLRSPKMDLGNIQCWMDDDKTRTETVEGYWRRETSVGQQQEFTFGLKHRPTGKHQLHCENVGNPANATMSTFLIIGLFTV